MATQFGNALFQFRLQQDRQALDAYLPAVRHAAPLAIELREVPDCRVTAQRQTVSPSHIDKMRECPGVAVHIVIRIEMGGEMAHQGFESEELFPQDVTHPPGGVGTPADEGAPKIRVQSDAQSRQVATELGRLFAPGRVHEQAGTREDTAPVRLDNAAVDTATGPQIVAVDDETLRHEGTARRWSSENLHPRLTPGIGQSRSMDRKDPAEATVSQPRGETFKIRLMIHRCALLTRS